MTVKDSGESAASRHMAKRQKTDTVAKDVQDLGEARYNIPSELTIGIIDAATRTPDMNIVDFSDDISDFEITPGSKPLSSSDIPRRQKVKQKKKKHTKGEHSKKHPTIDEKSQNKDGQSDSTNTNANTKS